MERETAGPNEGPGSDETGAANGSPAADRPHATDTTAPPASRRS
jgi:hypothetical protein